MILPKLGLEDEAREIYEQLLLLSEEMYVVPGIMGVLAASLGDYDAAFRHIEAGLANRSLVLSWLRDPLLDDFRNDARFIEMLDRVGLEP